MLLAREGANERNTTLHHLSKNFLWEPTYKYFCSNKQNVLLTQKDSPRRKNSLFLKLGKPLILTFKESIVHKCTRCKHTTTCFKSITPNIETEKCLYYNTCTVCTEPSPALKLCLILVKSLTEEVQLLHPTTKLN